MAQIQITEECARKQREAPSIMDDTHCSTHAWNLDEDITDVAALQTLPESVVWQLNNLKLVGA